MSALPTTKEARRASGGLSPQHRQVLVGTLVGTSIEWYDFFIYATTASMVFAQLYFQPLGAENAALAQIVAFASIGISFLFRPLGAVIAGHLGDRLGRKKMLVLTLLLMGGSTAAMGLLPTFAQIGFWAPLMLMLLRILQGLSAGGEWGGAALMAVEHAPRERRGFFGAFPQVGVPIGMLMATIVLTTLTFVIGPEAFVAWGWRIPFLISVLLIVVGFFIRRSVHESPAFLEMKEQRAATSAPLRMLFSGHLKTVIKCALIFAGNNAAGWILIAYVSSYATKVLGMDQKLVLITTGIAAVAWLGTTLWSGHVSDKIGRVRTFQLGYVAVILWMVPMFLLIDTKNIWLLGVATVVLTFGLGFAYGPMSAMYAEMFPIEVRYSGVSIGYALGTILGGAFAPMVAQLLIDGTGWSPSIGIYIMALSAVSLIAVSTVKDGRNKDLGVAASANHLIP